MPAHPRATRLMQPAQVVLQKFLLMLLGLHSWVDGLSRLNRIPLISCTIMPVDTAKEQDFPEVPCIAVNIGAPEGCRVTQHHRLAASARRLRTPCRAHGYVSAGRVPPH